MYKLCLCGCGQNVSSEKNKFVNGHNKPNKGKIFPNSTRLKMSKVSVGRIISQDTKLKMSKIKIGKKHSTETKLKMSLNHRGMIGKTHSQETKLKQSLSHIKYVEDHNFNGRDMFPRLGKNEKYILDQLEKNTEIKILRNDRTISNITGKFIDGFSEKYNLAIDVLEKHHFKSNNELCKKDQNRELIIAWKLGCMIYYISEQEFLKNPEKEIHRFINFINTL